MELLYVVPDSPQANQTQKQLEQNKYQVTRADTLGDAEKQLKSRSFDILLCNDMPQDQYLGSLRKLQPALILLLAGHWNTAEQRIRVRKTGVDDCLTVPVDAQELTLLVQQLQRRRPAKIKFAGFEMNVGQRELTWKSTQERVVLSDRSFDLLALFASRANQVIDRDDLSRHIYGRAWDPKSRGVDVAVSNLRCKLRRYQRSEILIRSVRGRGYLLIIRG